MKYFLTSDIHGMDPKILKKELKLVNFDFNNPNHILCIAGDIADGMNHDNELISFLRKMKHTIILKGNHDNCDEYFVQINTNYVETLSEDNAEWLRSLETSYDGEHFNMSHGIYLEKNVREKLVNNSAIVWGSPCILGDVKSLENWWYIDEKDVEVINKHYDVENYFNDDNKKIFVGHFPDRVLTPVMEEKGLKLVKDKNGFLCYKNVCWLDRDLRRIKDNFKFYILEV